MLTDLLLAIAHHLLVFALAAALAAEFVLVRQGLGGRNLGILGHIDGTFGALAGSVVVIGASRVLFGLKGWEFYVYNHAFWAKMAAFAVVGLLSVPPTRRILGWRKAAASDDAYVVPDAEIAATRRFLRAELFVFALIPVFAAMMARDMG